MVDAIVIDEAVAFVRELLSQDDLVGTVTYLSSLHPADAADVLARLDDNEQQRLIWALQDETLAGLIKHTDEEGMAEIVEHMQTERLANVLDQVEPDVAADVLGELPAAQADDVLAYMEEAAGVVPLLQYPTDTAGGLMNRIFDVIEEETTEDIYRMAGMDEKAELFSPIRQAARTRLFWLVVNLITAFLASVVVSLFEATIARAAVLATFMPIIAGQGGNAGIQTSTIVIRSLALGRLELQAIWKALRYELMLGLVNGIAIGLIVSLVALLWKSNPMLGVVIGVAMVGNMLVAALSGVLIPFLLQRWGRIQRWPRVFF